MSWSAPRRPCSPSLDSTPHTRMKTALIRGRGFWSGAVHAGWRDGMPTPVDISSSPAYGAAFSTAPPRPSSSEAGAEVTESILKDVRV
jgi:hypothetical protein